MENVTNGTAPPGYVQRGITALRSPGGEFMASVPFYERAGPALRQGEESLIKDAAKLFAEELKLDGKGGD